MCVQANPDSNTQQNIDPFTFLNNVLLRIRQSVTHHS
jgi:hypothetical protein